MEACGVLPGPRGGDPARLVEMVNTAASTTKYAFDPDAQLALWREMDEHGEDPLVIYHSHTRSGAVPSTTDIEHAHEPTAVYVIVSTATGEVRAWRPDGDDMTEIPLVIDDD